MSKGNRSGGPEGKFNKFVFPKIKGGRMKSLIPGVGVFRRETPKVGRNEPCSCSSGRKFKKCCGAPKPILGLRELYAGYDTMDDYPEMTPGFYADEAEPVDDQ